VPHLATLPFDWGYANDWQKLLANRESDANSIKISSTVPRKPKKPTKEENKETAPAISPESASEASSTGRVSAKTKKDGTAPTKRAPAPKAAKPRKKAAPTSAKPPTDEEIRIRAYFIAERRHRLNLPGDTSSDWIEARRQLLAGDGAA
jgi:Protein of unknown function (DUF2934)